MLRRSFRTTGRHAQLNPARYQPPVRRQRRPTPPQLPIEIISHVLSFVIEPLWSYKIPLDTLKYLLSLGEVSKPFFCEIHRLIVAGLKNMHKCDFDFITALFCAANCMLVAMERSATAMGFREANAPESWTFMLPEIVSMEYEGIARQSVITAPTTVNGEFRDFLQRELDDDARRDAGW